MIENNNNISSQWLTKIFLFVYRFLIPSNMPPPPGAVRAGGGGGANASAAAGGANARRGMVNGIMFAVITCIFHDSFGMEEGVLLHHPSTFHIRVFPGVNALAPFPPSVYAVGGGGDGFHIPYDGFEYEGEEIYRISNILRRGIPINEIFNRVWPTDIIRFVNVVSLLPDN